MEELKPVLLVLFSGTTGEMGSFHRAASENIHMVTCVPRKQKVVRTHLEGAYEVVL